MTASLRAVLLATLLVFASALCVAQSIQGALEITVTDATGAVIPQANVEVENSATGLKRKAQTDPQGVARFVALPPGQYRVRVESAGFQILQTSFEVQPGLTAQHTVALEVGSVAETVEVRGLSPAIMTQSTYAVSVGGAPERYNRIEESGYKHAFKTPLSTFSSDVDTAAYSNVRRFLQDGHLPPKDAVRIEELLNYFRYDDPAPQGEHPLAIAAEVARCPWDSDHKLARIALRTADIAVADLPPASLTFLLDVSGSMHSPDKLPLLQQAFSLLVDQLRPQDSVAIVVYAGAAGVVLDPTPGDHKHTILQALERLRAGGSTAGAAGIRTAYELARRSFRKSGSNRVILATDGDFNVGVSNDDELIQLIERERESGVFLTVMGFGTGNLQDAKMEQLADHGNGQYLYIDSALEARRALVEQIGGTLVTVAKDVKIQVEFNPERVRRYRLIGYENRLLKDEDFANDKKDAGDMGAGHSFVALYEIVPTGAPPDEEPLRYQPDKAEPPAPPKSAELLFVKVRYKQPDAHESRKLEVPLHDADVPVEQASANLRWAAAVAAYGLLLRDSGYKGDASWTSAGELARSAMGDDTGGERAEFLYLLRTAEKLDGRGATSELR